LIFSGGRLLVLSNKAQTIDEGRELIRETFKNGTALQKFHDMMIGQGVAKAVADQLISRDENVVGSILKLSEISEQIVAPQAGFIQSIDSFKLGTVVQRLGRQFVFSRFCLSLVFLRWWTIEIY